MYYDNKSTFYVKQYGPATVVGICSVILIGCGLLIYIKTTDVKPNVEIAENKTIENNDKVINENNNIDTNKDETIKKQEEEKQVIENNALKDENKKDEIVTNYFDSLEKLTKSNECLVKSVSSTGSITIEAENTSKVDILLIGVDLSKSDPSVIENMKSDLLNKKVKIAFDEQKNQGSNTYAYLYVNDKLYNSELLKNGSVILKSERTNNTLLKELANSQKYARDNSLGVWKK